MSIKSNLKRLNELIEEGADFSVAVDHIVFDTECNREELIAFYDEEHLAWARGER
jgi:hypothetical protein